MYPPLKSRLSGGSIVAALPDDPQSSAAEICLDGSTARMSALEETFQRSCHEGKRPDGLNGDELVCELRKI